MNTCPRCGKNYDGYPALSCVDNATNICSACGTAEAAEEYLGMTLTPRWAWVVK